MFQVGGLDVACGEKGVERVSKKYDAPVIAIPPLPSARPPPSSPPYFPSLLLSTAPTLSHEQQMIDERYRALRSCSTRQIR